MTDDVLDSDQVRADSEQPNSQVTQTGDKQNSTQAAQPENIGDAIKDIQRQLRALQSEKDRGVNKTQKELEALRNDFREFTELTKSGLTEEAAIETMQSRRQQQAEEAELKETLRDLRTILKGGNPVSQQAKGTVDAARVIAEYGLDANDPQVVQEVLSKQWGNPVEAENAALKLALKRQIQPPPSPASSTAVQGQPTKTVDVASKIQVLAGLQKEPTKNREAIAKLTAELDAVNWGG